MRENCTYGLTEGVERSGFVLSLRSTLPGNQEACCTFQSALKCVIGGDVRILCIPRQAFSGRAHV